MNLNFQAVSQTSAASAAIKPADRTANTVSGSNFFQLLQEASAGTAADQTSVLKTQSLPVEAVSLPEQLALLIASILQTSQSNPALASEEELASEEGAINPLFEAISESDSDAQDEEVNPAMNIAVWLEQQITKLMQSMEGETAAAQQSVDMMKAVPADIQQQLVRLIHVLNQERQLASADLSADIKLTEGVDSEKQEVLGNLLSLLGLHRTQSNAKTHDTAASSNVDALKNAGSASHSLSKQPDALLVTPVQQQGGNEAIQRLEWLSLKSFVTVQQTDEASDSPLFQPLDLESQADGEQPVALLQELQNTQAKGQPTAKAPVLTMSASNFAEEFTQFSIRTIKLQSGADGMSEARLSLYPQHLGHVNVKLIMQNGHLTAQFMADTAAGKEMLESTMAQLRTTLQSQGIQVEKIEVTQSSELQSSMFQQQRQEQASQQSGKQNKSKSGNGTIEEDQSAAAIPPERTVSDDSGSIDITA